MDHVLIQGNEDTSLIHRFPISYWDACVTFIFWMYFSLEIQTTMNLVVQEPTNPFDDFKTCLNKVESKKKSTLYDTKRDFRGCNLVLLQQNAPT